jgi:hypothetical protein
MCDLFGFLGSWVVYCRCLTFRSRTSLFLHLFHFLIPFMVVNIPRTLSFRDTARAALELAFHLQEMNHLLRTFPLSSLVSQIGFQRVDIILVLVPFRFI